MPASSPTSFSSSSASSGAPVTSPAPNASSSSTDSDSSSIYYFIYIQTQTSLSIIYKYDAVESVILPLSTNLLKDRDRPPSHMNMGRAESKLIIGVLKDEKLIDPDETTWKLPVIVGINNQDMFRNFLPIKRHKAVALPKASSLISHISLSRPNYAPVREFTSEGLIERLKNFSIGLGSAFLTFEEARFCVLVYCQVVLKRPLNIFHSEVSRESYTVICHQASCPFTISIRPFDNPLPQQYRPFLVVTKYIDHTCKEFTHSFQSLKKSPASHKATSRLTYPKSLPLLFDFIHFPGRVLSSKHFDIFYDTLEEVFHINEVHHVTRSKKSKSASHRDLADTYCMDMFQLNRDSMPPVHVSALYLQLFSPLTCVRLTYRHSDEDNSCNSSVTTSSSSPTSTPNATTTTTTTTTTTSSAGASTSTSANASTNSNSNTTTFTHAPPYNKELAFQKFSVPTSGTTSDNITMNCDKKIRWMECLNSTTDFRFGTGAIGGGGGYSSSNNGNTNSNNPNTPVPFVPDSDIEYNVDLKWELSFFNVEESPSKQAASKRRSTVNSRTTPTSNTAANNNNNSNNNNNDDDNDNNNSNVSAPVADANLNAPSADGSTTNDSSNPSNYNNSNPVTTDIRIKIPYLDYETSIECENSDDSIIEDHLVPSDFVFFGSEESDSHDEEMEDYQAASRSTSQSTSQVHTPSNKKQKQRQSSFSSSSSPPFRLSDIYFLPMSVQSKFAQFSNMASISNIGERMKQIANLKENVFTVTSENDVRNMLHENENITTAATVAAGHGNGYGQGQKRAFEETINGRFSDPSVSIESNPNLNSESTEEQKENGGYKVDGEGDIEMENVNDYHIQTQADFESKTGKKRQNAKILESSSSSFAAIKQKYGSSQDVNSKDAEKGNRNDNEKEQKVAAFSGSDNEANSDWSGESSTSDDDEDENGKYCDGIESFSKNSNISENIVKFDSASGSGNSHEEQASSKAKDYEKGNGVNKRKGHDEVNGKEKGANGSGEGENNRNTIPVSNLPLNCTSLMPMTFNPHSSGFCPSYCDLYHCSNPRNSRYQGYCKSHEHHHNYVKLYRTMVENRTNFNPFLLGDYIDRFYPEPQFCDKFQRMTIITGDMRRMAQNATTLIEVGHVECTFGRTNNYYLLLAVANTPEGNITILGSCISANIGYHAYLEFFTELKLAYASVFAARKPSFISAAVSFIAKALAAVFPDSYHCISFQSATEICEQTNSISYTKLIEIFATLDKKSYDNSASFWACNKIGRLMEAPQVWTVGFSGTPRFGKNYATNIQTVRILLESYLHQANIRLPLALNNLQTEIINAQKQILEDAPLIKFSRDNAYFLPAASRALAHAAIFVDQFKVEKVKNSQSKFTLKAIKNSILCSLQNNASAIPLLLDAVYFERGGPTPIRRERIKASQTKEKYEVDLSKGTCSCSFYQDNQLPCIHALACILKFRDGKVSCYSSPIYFYDRYYKVLQDCDCETLTPLVTDLQFVASYLSKLDLHNLKADLTTDGNGHGSGSATPFTPSPEDASKLYFLSQLYSAVPYPAPYPYTISNPQKTT